MKLRQWRNDNDYTQKQVAAVVGIDTTMVSKYERRLAKPTLLHLAIIHKLTNRQVTVEDFLYDNESAAIESVDCQSLKNTSHSNTSSSPS